MNNDQPWTLLQGDAAEQMAKLDAGSVDLIVTDPPYFRVKDEPWDRAWNDRDAFLAWLGTVADEWRRVLKPNGSLYVFASPQMAARVQVEVVAPRFDVLNEIVWVKPGGGTGERVRRESLRRYLINTERIVFAQPFGADGEHTSADDKLRGSVFEPLRAYLEGERVRAGVSKIDVNVACGFSATPGGMASRHYFSKSQWWLPTREHYEAMRDLFNEHEPGDYLRREFDDLRREWDYLRRDWDDLRREFEELRRPFAVTADVPHREVWDFRAPRGRGRHVCEKPVDLLRHAIRVSSRPGGVVLDSFAGSASTGEAALLEGRHFIGIDADAGWVKKGQQRLAAVTSQSQQPTLWNAS